MKEKTLEMLEEDIRSTIAYIRTLERGTEEHKSAIEHLTALQKIAIEDQKLYMEDSSKKEQFKQTLDMKKMEISEQKKERWFRLATAVLVITIELSFYATFSYYGFKFEETGNINSNIFKMLINKFKFTK